jgi:hypothetical protein
MKLEKEFNEWYIRQAEEHGTDEDGEERLAWKMPWNAAIEARDAWWRKQVEQYATEYIGTANCDAQDVLRFVYSFLDAKRPKGGRK